MNGTSTAALVLVAVACLVLMAAVLLLLHDRRKNAHKAVRSYLQQTLERQINVVGGAMSTAAASETLALKPGLRREIVDSRPALNTRWAVLAIWGVSHKAAGLILAAGLALCLLVAVKTGAVLACLVLLVYLLLTVFVLWRRLQKQRQRMLEQLPGFLDNMVRLITIGNSTQASFQMAVPSVPMPLGQALGQAASVLAASSNLGQAMDNLARTWKLPEFGLLAAVFRMSTQYGGRTDQVLDRVSSYIRDRMSAERELHAMSAEVRLSAWILSLLPIVVGVLIMVMNDGYFMRMWRDDGGRQMIAMAAGLELVGVVMLYRLARLR